MPLVPEPELTRSTECNNTNVKIGEILSAVVKVEDDEKKKENEVNLVPAKLGDLR